MKGCLTPALAGLNVPAASQSHVTNRIQVDDRTYDVAHTLDSAKFCSDAMIEALNRRARGGSSVLLSTAEHLIQEAADAAALAELYALESYLENVVSRGSNADASAAMRLGAVLRHRRAGAANRLAHDLKERAQW